MLALIEKRILFLSISFSYAGPKTLGRSRMRKRKRLPKEPGRTNRGKVKFLGQPILLSPNEESGTEFDGVRKLYKGRSLSAR